jgi:hypothetical protein
MNKIKSEKRRGIWFSCFNDLASCQLREYLFKNFLFLDEW